MMPFRRMAENNGYANETLYAAISEPREGAFTAPAAGFFPSLCETMNHIHEVDLYYLDALERGGAGRSVFERAAVSDPRRLAALQRQVDERFVAFCAALSPERLAEVRSTERSSGDVVETVENLVLHLVQHQIHHRGQAHVQISQVGGAPPQLDDFHLDFGRVPVAERWRS